MRTRTALFLGLFASTTVAASCDSSTPTTAPSPAAPFGNDVPVSSTLPLEGLSGGVDMVRDAHGMVHIFATTVPDALKVEGYQMGRDRTVQLELYRRSAEGRLAEVLGDLSPSLVDEDITARTIGLKRVADQMYASLDPGSEIKEWLDAFADGISQLNAKLQSGEEKLPRDMFGIDLKFLEPWTGADVLAVGRLQSQKLAYSAESEVGLSTFVEEARAAFPATSADPLVAKRASLLVDLVRFAPNDPTTVLPGFPNDLTHTMSRRTHTPTPLPITGEGLRRNWRVDPAVLHQADGWRAATARMHDRSGGARNGSNNWVVGPSLTTSGHAMIASDPHLDLNAPSTFWAVQIDVTAPPGGDSSKDMHVTGMAFPGIPGIILGFNPNVAWGATTADYDVTDIYAETLTADGNAVVQNGKTVALETIHETIKVAGGRPDVEYDVRIVPGHGPLIPNIQDHQVAPIDPAAALSIAWTGSQPTKELFAVSSWMRAKNVDEVRAAAHDFAVGAQNWVFADTHGDIFYTSQSRIPLRDKRAYTWDPKSFSGTIPCMVLPGDGTAEWTGGELDEAYVPHVKNPAKGYVATANGDQVGDTLDDDPTNDLLPNGQPVFMGCFHDPGFRVGRIAHRIETMGRKISLDDMASIQADAHSNTGAILGPMLFAALGHAQSDTVTPNLYPDLTAIVKSARYSTVDVANMQGLLTSWRGGDYDTPSGLNPDDGSPSLNGPEVSDSETTLLMNAWMVRMLHLTFDDELAKMGWTLDDVAPLNDPRPALIYLLNATDRTTLATYDAASGDSALFDDMTTPDVVESREALMVTAFLDALDYVKAKLGADESKWRWGAVHTVHFDSLVPLWGALSIPPGGDLVFPKGFPRHGEAFTVDVGEYSGLPADIAHQDFSYTHGPVQRFVIDVDPAGPIARNAMPGGEIWDSTSKHFADEAELWRRNQNHPVPVSHADVVTATDGEHVVYAPKAGAGGQMLSPGGG